MVALKPFRGWHALPELASEVACPPYDVLSTEQAREMALRHPQSFVRVIRPECILPVDDPHDTDSLHETARHNLDSMIARRLLVEFESPSFFLYCMKRAEHSQLGLVAEIPIEEYEAGSVKVHELTLERKLEDRTRHILATEANTGPVLLAARLPAVTKSLFERLAGRPPLVEVEDEEGTVHTLWKVGLPSEIEKIEKSFGEVDALYIADGHHRATAAARALRLRKARGLPAERWGGFLGVVFPHDSMRILPYHRILKRFGKTDELLRKLSGAFRVEPSPKAVLPSSPGMFGLFTGGKWYVLTPREPEIFDDGKELDCDFLQKKVFGPLYGIDDPRTDPRLDFAGGSLGPDELVRQAADGALFTLAPVSIRQVMQVADSGGIMPPKSTWFHPKLLSGLVVRSTRGG